MPNIKGVPQMDATQSKCRVGIMRRASVTGGRTDVGIFVNGVKVATLSNGSSIRLILDPGRHVMSFGVGNTILRRVNLDLNPGTDTNLICRKVWKGIEAAPTSIDVCSLIADDQSSQPKARGRGWLMAIAGLAVFLIGISILLVKLKIVPFPIR